MTGTRLQRPLAGAPVNSVVLGRDDLERSGRANLSEILRELPELAVTGITENVAISGTRGATSVDLRALGTGNTLLLVNGRRVTASANSFGETVFVDLNRFPTGNIERVEILKGGASAVYGADAVAGVVNIVTRRGAAGGELRVSHANTFDTDAAETQVTLRQGAARGRLSLSINADFFHRNALANRDRWFSATANLAPRFASTYDYFAKLPATQLAAYDGRSLTGPIARIALNGGQVNGLNGVNIPGLAAGAAITALPGTGGVAAGTQSAVSPGIIAPYTQPTGGQFHAAAAASFVPQQLTRTDNAARNLYNFNQDEWLVPATDRAGLGLRLDCELPGGAVFFADISAQRNRSRMELFAAGFTAAVPRTNFYNPFGVDVTVAMRLVKTGPRRSLVEDDTWSALAGLRAADHSRVDWEIAAGYSANEFVDTMANALVRSRTLAALERTDQGALNPFGGETFRHDPTLIRGLTTPTWRGGQASLFTLDGRASWTVWQLPAGPLRAAVHGEHRREEFSAASDPISRSGDLFGQGQTGADADWQRGATAFAAEVHAPLWKAAPDGGPAGLILEAAGRWENFSGGFASGVRPSLGLVARPRTGLLLRASWAETFKAPTLPQLHAPQSEGFFNSVPDPRRPVALTGDSFDGPNVSRLVRSGGNPGLLPEEGVATQVGAAWTPERGPFAGLAVEATWFRYEIEDMISGIGPTQVLNDELGALGYLVERDAGTEAYTNTSGAPIPILSGPNGQKRSVAPGETATVPGRLRRISTYTINLARRRLVGTDLAAHYGRDLGTWGRARLGAGATYIDEVGYAADRYTAFNNSAGAPNSPRWRVRSTIDWMKNRWSAGATYLFTASSGELAAWGSYLKPYRVVNLHAAYAAPRDSWLRGATVTVGIDDLFEDDPPLYNDPPIGYSYSTIPRPQGRSWRVAIKQVW